VYHVLLFNRSGVASKRKVLCNQLGLEVSWTATIMLGFTVNAEAQIYENL
jgi:hypothetical protein